MLIAIVNFMNPSEAAIIYFSIGAAVGAHYFFKANRIERQRRMIRAKVLSVTMLWPGYALWVTLGRFERRYLTNFFAFSPFLDSKNHLELRIARKNLESLLAKASETAGLFSWRETLDRYTSLSLAAADPFESRRFEILRHSPNAMQETQVICLNRRNRERLKLHRKNACNEFMNSLARLLTISENPGKAGIAAVEFAKLLNDEEAANRIEQLVADLKQTRRSSPVRELENRTWIPQEQ
ncbi:MAG: hypothetical protein OEM82_03980 [Acidobacteriota bacterium]|nr:hypothetical protein [Acidobacteriota bacterium]MDH3529780.1 hypothetical protein [Acidobacteriota bacterium]